ncbi:uncharacterized protein LOC124649551 [Lolium rigidum]|uniref:uncharacterized protein LOC124649551 n=1 Tax=Lolium rigidum TaxID=89674 RepID=UPI001F5DFC7F|nr:uncharacterized protein LOC124649551 [Lolium rigidum]
MASAARYCAVCCFGAADEVAPTDTLRVLRLQRLRLRRAATGCLDPIAEEEEDDDDDVPTADSPGAYTSSSSPSAVDLAQSHR